jgi:hypothetical protein
MKENGQADSTPSTREGKITRNLSGVLRVSEAPAAQAVIMTVTTIDIDI